MDDQQDREIARGLRDGKTEAWSALYETYFDQVWRWVARMIGPNSADVGDVVQETFLAAARSARTYDPARGPLGRADLVSRLRRDDSVGGHTRPSGPLGRPYAPFAPKNVPQRSVAEPRGALHLIRPGGSGDEEGNAAGRRLWQGLPRLR